MLEQETDLILQLLTERTIGQQDTIPLKDVFGSPIPKNVKKYFQCEVVRWLSSDLRSTPSFSRIPPNAKNASAIMESMLQSLAPEYTFDRKEFISTLENAVHFLENYLCRPHWTLEHFLFEKEEQISVDSMEPNLEYFTDYSYLRDLIGRAVRLRGRTEIHRADFRSLIEKIDEQVVTAHSPYEMALLTKPIYDFLCLEEATVDRVIPLKPILVFFDDKKMKTVKEYIEHSANARGQSDLSLAGLGRILDSHFAGVSHLEEELPSVTPQEAINKITIPQPSPSELRDDIDAGEEIPETVIPDERLLPGEDSLADESEPVVPTVPEQTTPPAESPRQKTNPTLSLTFAGLKETQQARPLPDISSIITQEQKDRFHEKMFKNDDAYYAGIIAALNRTPTWKEASRYLNVLYQTNGLDPFAEEVVEFTDVIHSRYNPPEANPE